MRYLIIKKVGIIFTFTESSNGTLEDGIIYSGNALEISAYNSLIHIKNEGVNRYHALSDIKYKSLSFANFALFFNELMIDGFTGNFKTAGVAATIPVQLKDFYVDASNSFLAETDLYSYQTTANRLSATGQKLVAVYGGKFNDATASSQLKVYYAGVLIGDTGALTMSVIGAWVMNVSVMRTGETSARVILNIATPGASTASYTNYVSLTGLTFTNGNILKVTGTAAGATGGSGDITASYGNILWQPASI